MSIEIISQVTRYIVPFWFDCSNDKYEIIKKHFLNIQTLDTSSENYQQALGLPKKGGWKCADFWGKTNKSKQPEIDLFSYLPSIFLEDENAGKKDASNLGSSLIYGYEADGKLFEIKCTKEEKKAKEKEAQEKEAQEKKWGVTINLVNLGILLLRNGIGFIWYETNYKDTVSAEEHIEIQYAFKELARSKGNSKLIFTRNDQEFQLGKWLSEVVSADKLDIRFWAERKDESDGGEKTGIPDKALLFQYMFIEKVTEQQKTNLIFQMANGYNDKYNAPENLSETLYKPFNNICYYISRAGMACLAENDNTNKDFFKNQFEAKYNVDYFFIYLLLLYQSYSCAHYSRQLTELPADIKRYKKNNIGRLESLNEQINLFLVKSVFDSVSNIHHQNGVYRYGKDVLCIHEDIDSLTIGLDALKEIEKDKRDSRIDRALAIFGFMVVVSALIDGFSLVDRFRYSENPIIPWHWIVLGVILVLAIYLIIVMVRNRRK